MDALEPVAQHLFVPFDCPSDTPIEMRIALGQEIFNIAIPAEFEGKTIHFATAGIKNY